MRTPWKLQDGPAHLLPSPSHQAPPEKNGVFTSSPSHQAHPNKNCVLVCNETLTPAFYKGKDKNRLVTNMLFR